MEEEGGEAGQQGGEQGVSLLAVAVLCCAGGAGTTAVLLHARDVDAHVSIYLVQGILVGVGDERWMGGWTNSTRSKADVPLSCCAMLCVLCMFFRGDGIDTTIWGGRGGAEKKAKAYEWHLFSFSPLCHIPTIPRVERGRKEEVHQATKACDVM